MASQAQHVPPLAVAQPSNDQLASFPHQLPFHSVNQQQQQQHPWTSCSPSLSSAQLPSTQPPIQPSCTTDPATPAQFIPSVESTALPTPTSTLSPSITPSTQTNHPFAHLQPATQPKFTWQYIWSFFARAPRVRSWLFQKDPPPATHVVQSLLSSPMLIGYIFGSDHERDRMYPFPDIGDLQTVYCRDGDAFLGFHFGFQGIQPVVPLMFQVMTHPLLSNSNVTVRRTARQRAPPPYDNYYLVIEVDWFESGAIGIITSVCPNDPESVQPTGLCPYILYGEHRIFGPTTAARLSSIAERLAENVDLGFFPDASHFEQTIPQDFLDPQDDYFFLTVREPDDPNYHASLSPAYLPHDELQHNQTFHVEREITNATTPISHTTANSSTTSATSNTPPNVHPGANNDSASDEHAANVDSETVLVHRAGASVQSDKHEVTSVAEKGTCALWSRYRTKVAQSRRTGTILTMLGNKDASGKHYVFGRDCKYVFLSTCGINVNGRIQKLCSQLGIKSSSPLPDQALLSPEQDEDDHDSETKGDGEIDISHIGRGVNEEWERRRIEQGLNNVAARANVVNFSARSLSTNGFAAGEQWIRGDATESAKEENCEYEPGTMNSARHLKRRRCAAPNASVQNTELNQPLFPFVKAQSIDFMVNRGMNAMPSKERNDSMSFSLHREDSNHRRSFDLDHILSSDNGLHSPLNALHRKDSPDSIQEILSPQESTFPKKEPSPREVENSIGEAGEQSPKLTADPGKGKGGRTTVWTCDRCGAQIRGKKGNLNRHIANKHDNIRAFACKREGCGRRFQTRLNLVRHETAVHEGRPHTCPSCPRAFKYEDDLKAHIKSAHDEPDATLACQVCGSCFGRRSTLNRHMAKVHKIKPQSAAQVQAV